jgi:hypothetical protein
MTHPKNLNTKLPVNSGISVALKKIKSDIHITRKRQSATPGLCDFKIFISPSNPRHIIA